MPKVSYDKKNLNRIAGELLVASRFAQRGYMVSLQWGTASGYDILVFDKDGKVAFLEVKSSASYNEDWALQAKYAKPKQDKIPIDKRFVACVDLTQCNKEPTVYIFPVAAVAKGLKYFFNGEFPNSPTFHLPLRKRPIGKSKDKTVQTVGEYIKADNYLEKYDIVEVGRIKQ